MVTTVTVVVGAGAVVAGSVGLAVVAGRVGTVRVAAGRVGVVRVAPIVPVITPPPAPQPAVSAAAAASAPYLKDPRLRGRVTTETLRDQADGTSSPPDDDRMDHRFTVQRSMEWTLPAIAVIILAFAAVSGRLEGTSITAPMVFMGAGLVLGAKAAGLVNPSSGGTTAKLLASATLAVVLFGDAARIDLRTLREEFRVPARLLGIALPLTVAAGFLVALLLFGSLGWPEALVLAIVLAPTDAALGQSVVTLPSLPSLIRQGLNVESGLNDGLCVPLFGIAIAIASTEAGLTGVHHAVVLVAEEIGYGMLVGVGVGALAAAVVVFAGGRGLVEPVWLQVVPAAAAALAYTTAAAIHGSGFIAAFVAGLVFGALRHRVGGEVGYLVEELGALLGAATFVVFGAAFLEPALGGITWAVAGYAILSLTVVRMLPVAIAMVGTRARRPTLAFLGWFGPRGLASIVFAVLIVEESGTLPHESLLLTTIYATVGLSVLLHGLTAAPLARRYARWYSARPASGVQSESVHEVRWRTHVAPPTGSQTGAGARAPS